MAALVIAGLPSQDIAATLFISPNTVRDYAKTICGKGTRDRIGQRC